MRITDGDWELDHELSIPNARYVWRKIEADGTITVRTDYPVDPLLEASKNERADTAGERWGDYRKVASIPVGLAYGENREAFQDPAWLKRWLNDGDNAAFRTKEGRV